MNPSSSHIVSDTLLIVLLTFNLNGYFNHGMALALPQSGVSPEFRCDRLCYPWKTECNSISYLVEDSPTCWRCCLIPTNTTTTSTTSTTTTAATIRTAQT
ncbi:hypothetical protein BYT27DRAFT_7188618 [Phlegmacium glaucopus]|nr:hypothetical protein BYT27DRAFT_7188618 [Phlegmacium glaucopus]